MKLAVLLVLQNIVVLGGTAYLVGWRDWSPWWFLFAATLVNVPVSGTIKT